MQIYKIQLEQTMQNKKTGPVTIPGKEASSKNALKHGATSPKLINEDEQERYKNLLEGLAKKYPSDNPLIELQLARIARTTIQLERIQNVIDASFIKSRMRGNTSAKLMEAFSNENAQVQELAVTLFHARSKFDLEESRAIAFELIHAEEIEEIQSMDEFVEGLPRLNAHIEDRERYENRSATEILISEVEKFSDIHKQYCDAIREPNEMQTHADEIPDNKPEAKDRKLGLLKMFALWHSKILKGVFLGPEANFTLEESINIEEEAILPEAQEMDRLMRYQTSLQRQLSASIGELLAIRKVDTDF
jgi:hypothetical protein